MIIVGSLALGALRQLGDDDAVADEDDQTGQYEAHYDVLEAETNCPFATVFYRPGKHQVRYSQQSCRQPHPHIDHSARKQLPCGLAVGGPHNCQVHCVDHVHRHTEETPKVPGFGCIHGPEGQREDQQEVRHGEMEPDISGLHCRREDSDCYRPGIQKIFELLRIQITRSVNGSEGGCSLKNGY
ncbi:hypothetical protein EYF80_001053 [Liparis tanakae]|uniref:Uncharacterized protein n=1 Tax=Liparis tanakae TaxID=230148 RepID=A0A4Z2JFB9_9TELE|nr:hypothetical protein EYF80_001053 [Liparis tanakae]